MIKAKHGFIHMINEGSKQWEQTGQDSRSVEFWAYVVLRQACLIRDSR